MQFIACAEENFIAPPSALGAGEHGVFTECLQYMPGVGEKLQTGECWAV